MAGNGPVPWAWWQFKASAPAKLSKPVGAPVGSKHRHWGGRGFKKEKNKVKRGRKGRKREAGDDMVPQELGTTPFSSTDPALDFPTPGFYNLAVSKAHLSRRH